VGSPTGEVRRSALRNLLTAALIHATDEQAPPAELVLTAEPQSRGVRIDLALRPGTGDGGFANEPGYRGLAWSDVEALAVSEGVEAERGDGRISLMFPWA
jgi:hypothetical protein